MHIDSFKWWLQRAHLIKHHTKWPNITFERIWSTFDDFRWKIIRCSYHRPCNIYRVLQYPSDAKVTKFDKPLFRQEHILALDISMQDLPVVDMLHAKTNLGKPVKNLRLRKVPSLLLLDGCSQISTICIVHHDTQVSFLGLIRFPEPDNIWMIEYLQDLCFLQCLYPFLLAHLGNDDLFDDSQRFVAWALHQKCFAKCAFAKQLDFVVCFELLLWRWLFLNFHSG